MDETIDEILDGGLRVCQSRRGYRFNLDSLMLSHFVTVRPGSLNMDLGCGNGIILLVLARRYPETRWVGLEFQPALSALAQKNIELNGLTDRVTIVTGSAGDVQNHFKRASYDQVVFNPPYRKILSGRVNPMEEKAVARHEVRGSLTDFLEASKYLLKPSGRAFVVYPASRLVQLVFEFRRHDIEPKRMKLVFSDRHSRAQFVLAEGRRSSREELCMEAPLVIYEEPGVYTEDMKSLFSDLARSPSCGDD
ncbi:MAG: methyltransferase [Smithellaceae bacterium]